MKKIIKKIKDDSFEFAYDLSQAIKKSLESVFGEDQVLEQIWRAVNENSSKLQLTMYFPKDMSSEEIEEKLNNSILSLGVKVEKIKIGNVDKYTGEKEVKFLINLPVGKLDNSLKYKNVNIVDLIHYVPAQIKKCVSCAKEIEIGINGELINGTPYCKECASEFDKRRNKKSVKSQDEKEKNKTYRGAKDVEYVWHGEWSDPELIYKDVSFNYWDVEDALYDDCLDQGLDADNEEVFNKYVQENVNSLLDDWIAAGGGKKVTDEKLKKYVCYLDGNEFTTVTAKNEDEAYSQFEVEAAEEGISLNNTDATVKLDEDVDEEKEICEWCGEEGELEKTSVGKICHKCKKAIESKEGSLNDIDLLSAVKEAYGFNNKEAREWIKKASKESKEEIIKGFKQNAKKSFEEDSKKVKDASDDIRIYMNTWANYNENGADLSKYGINSIIDGWMTIDEAREFAEKYAEDEPFFNDWEGIPNGFEISEYSNIEETLDSLEKYDEYDNYDKKIISAIMEAGSYDLDEAIDVFDKGDFWYIDGVDNDTDLAHAVIDEIGGLNDALGKRINDYIDVDEMKRAYEDDVREMMYEDANYDKSEVAEDNDVEEDEVTEDMIQDWIDKNIDDYVDSLVDEELALAERGEADLSDYFDYEAYGRDLAMDFFFTEDGAIELL